MSPLNEARDPVKENIGKGTGIGTLTPTYENDMLLAMTMTPYTAY